MEFLTDIWPVLVIVIATVGTFFGTKSFWPYITFGKESVDVFAKVKEIDSDKVRTDAEVLAVGKEFLEAYDAAGVAFKKKVAKVAGK